MGCCSQDWNGSCSPVAFCRPRRAKNSACLICLCGRSRKFARDPDSGFRRHFRGDNRGNTDRAGRRQHYARGAWRAVVSSDILSKLLLKARPYETPPGSADQLYEESLTNLCRTLEITYSSDKEQMEALQECLVKIRDRFRVLEIHLDPHRSNDRRRWRNLLPPEYIQQQRSGAAARRIWR